MRKRLGFTILEAVLSVALLGASILVGLYAWQTTVTYSLLADQTIIATNVASQALEQIAAQRDCTGTGCGYSSTLASIQGNSYNANPPTGYAGYVLTVTALEVSAASSGGSDDFLAASPGSGYARVTAKVAWNNGTNNIQLVTLMTNY